MYEVPADCKSIMWQKSRCDRRFGDFWRVTKCVTTSVTRVKGIKNMGKNQQESSLKIADLRKAQKGFKPQKNQERIEVSIDRVTVLVEGNPYLIFKDIKKSLQENLPHGFSTAQDEFNSMSISRHLEDGSIVNLFYVEVTGKVNVFVRIDFNPNRIKKYGGMGIWRQLMAYITLNKLESHLSRLDLAFDVYNMPSIINLKHVKGGVSEKVYYGRSGELETRYFGSRSSNIQVRLYDKNKEKLSKNELTKEDLQKSPYHWRFEMQLRTKAIDENTISEVISRLGKFGLYDYTALANDSQFAYFYLHDESLIPTMYPNLSTGAIRQKKYRIRQKLNELQDEFAEKTVKALREQSERLAKDLRLYTQEFLGFE